MAIEPDGPAPYAPPLAVTRVVEQHRERGLPTPITTEVIARVIESDALAPRVMKALRLYDLVDDEGQPTAQFTEMARATSDSEFRERFADIVRAAYADVFQYVNPAEVDAERLAGQFRRYEPRGQRERMVMLFRGLCEYTGIMPRNAERAERTRRPARPRPASNGPSRRERTPSRQEQERKADPPGKTGLPRSPIPEDVEPSPEPATGRHPFIAGLVQMLPPAGTEWPIAKRNAWAQAALSAFEVIYELPAEDRKGGEEP